MSRSIIPVPGEGLQFIFIEDSGGALIHIKPSVDTYNSLPITGNTENDLRITRDTDRMYTWSIASASGARSNWQDIGQSISIDWAAITNKPASSTADIDDAVAKKHSHANKALLDTYDQTNSDVEDAVDKKHTQNTDTGLDSGGANPITAAEAKQAFDAMGYVGTKDVNEAQIGDNKVTTYDLATGKIVYKNRIGVQGGVTYFLHEEASDIGGYEKLLGTPADDVENTEVINVTQAEGEKLIEPYVTDAGIPGTTILSGGVWLFNTYASIDSAVGTSEIIIRVYKRSTGGAETELFSISTGEIDAGSATLFPTETVQPDFIIDATDRIVIKYFGLTTRAGGVNLTLYYEGTANYTHIHTPLVSTNGGGHTQNTDTGTNSPTFALDTEASGFDPVKIKNESGQVSVRNNADNDYVDFQAKNVAGVDAEFTGEIGDASNKADADTILTSSFQYILDGAGAVLTVGMLGDVQVEFDCEIIGVKLLCADVGLIKVDIWSDSYANFPPTDADTITGGNEPEISVSGGSNKYQDNTLTSWTKTLSAGDSLRFRVDSVTTITRCNVVLKVRKT